MVIIEKIQKVLTIKTTKNSRSQVTFWFSLSLAFSAIYSILALREAFSSKYVVQDDARQHVFWMLRFLDPELFPQDFIADYFQSVAPRGYTAFYQLMASVGINPLLFNKLLPLILGLITTSYCFGICLQMLPVPAAGFICSLLLNQCIWMKEDLISATPRAFAYPLFLAFLYYVLQRSRLGSAVAIALLGLFYPQYLFVSVGILILQLLHWHNGRLCLSQNRSDYLLCASGLGVALLVMLPYALESSEFGPAITAAAARQLPEFLPGGRTQFFHENSWTFWLNGQRSGMLPRSLLKPEMLYLGLLLPILLRFPSQFPLARQVTSKVTLLPQIALAALLMFFAAHTVLFKLHVPSRYTGQSLRIIMALAAGMALMLILDGIWQWTKPNKAKANSPSTLPRDIGIHNPKSTIQNSRQFLALGVTVLIGAALVLYPSFVPDFPFTKYTVGKVPELYEFFQKQPNNILIASLAEEANNLPTFSQRSILAGREYAIPYQIGYYSKFRQRTIDLIRAQYSQDVAEVKNLLRTYGVDFWLLERTAFTPEYLAKDKWIRQYPPAAEAQTRLEQQAIPALAKSIERCSVFETQSLVVLQAECIVQTPKE
jgi:hypothetical protein